MPIDEEDVASVRSLLRELRRKEPGRDRYVAPGETWVNSQEGLSAYVEDLSRNGRYVIVRVTYAGSPRLRVFEKERFLASYTLPQFFREGEKNDE